MRRKKNETKMQKCCAVNINKNKTSTKEINRQIQDRKAFTCTSIGKLLFEVMLEESRNRQGKKNKCSNKETS